MIVKLFCFLNLLLLSPATFAGLFFEPLAGYESGSGTWTSQASLPTRNFKMSGAFGGARFGAQVSRFWVAIEPLYSQGDIKSDYSSGTSGTDTYSQTRVNGLIGFELFNRIGLWVGGAVYNQQKEIYSASTSTITLSSAKAGLGLRIKRFSFNLEYQSETPTKIVDSASGEINLSSNYSKLTSSRSSASFSWYF